MYLINFNIEVFSWMIKIILAIKELHPEMRSEVSYWKDDSNPIPLAFGDKKNPGLQGF